jgi:8-oxo-dGTP pyrophosphatase MutT (NUDIX family)
LEPGESPAAALQRELREELGIDAEIGQSLAAINHADGRFRIRLHFLAVTAFTGEMDLRVHDATAWVTPAEMSDYTFAPTDREYVARLGTR